MVQYRLCMFLLAASCDMLGANRFTPWYESPSAHMHCRQCNYDTRKSIASRAFSFLRINGAGQDCGPKLRVWDQPGVKGIRKVLGELRKSLADGGGNCRVTDD